MKIYLGADHKGYKLKKKVAEWLIKLKHDFEDLGAEEYDRSDDYTKYAARVASMVAENENSFGILMCGSGVGVDIMANKFDGARASFGKSVDQVKAGRRDDDMNILVLASDYTDGESAKKMVKAFLTTKFDKSARHKRRLADIEKIEENN
ncbi:MAG: Ribose 5-phosphate isomerase B [Candidatus Woesebacteria bacterium GW2011_GWB1_43_14]|uniref:Ribose 5-phosphate isomerase B n=1 Tax=Candidatus Woesebacteria bacterium GW2011_GWB1_43_14 TaxID=1618578 RepID=A0A0G1DM06_9BACT|nr:MAG: ribose 5-phosphate epimerase, ribose 5-phosphate isomerase B [Candidatus Woesebacteria bacterium GW2011_GWC1_42_9]KKS98915.1 MAG: Ribose 5-phosphate isomerase B [Candidatus Woesebacteria bacterium GW2011_GWB1_43_14]